MSETMSTRRAVKPSHRYRSPPVHEVILDVQFHENVGEKELRDIRKQLADGFDRADQQSTVEVLMSVGSHGQEVQTAPRRFAGWLFRNDPPDWSLRVAPNQVTLHAMRPGPWPTGEYVGWSAVFDRFDELYTTLSVVYGDIKIKRAGLRYLNRIAIPQGEDLAEWLAIPLSPPGPLHNLYTFNVRHTWASAEGADDLSATIGLVKIDIEDPNLSADHDGILLDIDVFNLFIPKAPSWQNLLDWYARAHQLENDIFESLITDRLRERFDR